MPSRHFHELLERMKEVHDRKSHDYAQDHDPFSNFRRAAQIVDWFRDPSDQVFAGIIGIKLARLAELMNGKQALNESMEDNLIDLANYVGLWYAFYKDRQEAISVKANMGTSKLESDPDISC